MYSVVEQPLYDKENLRLYLFYFNLCTCSSWNNNKISQLLYLGTNDLNVVRGA